MPKGAAVLIYELNRRILSIFIASHRIASSYFEVQQHNEEIPVPYTPYPTTPYNCSEELILEIWLYIEKEFLNIVRDIIKDIMFDNCYTKVEANS